MQQATHELEQWQPDAPAGKGSADAAQQLQSQAFESAGAREELLAQQDALLSAMEAATQQHAQHRRDLQQGGCIPAHFVTLTTAIYHWADLAGVLEDYERFTTANRHGRSDPFEPGEEALPAHTRRVQRYSGVVAWFCALKLELYASYVLCYDDLFAVYEWGSGGIVHLHLLGWRLPGFGRYDYEQGEVPDRQRREDARAMAWQHGAEIAEWNLGRQDKWETVDGFDEDLTPLNPIGEYGAQPLTDDSDCETHRLAAERETHEEASPAVQASMQELAALLRDPQWHPSALPIHLKRILLTCRSPIVRRMRRWYYVVLTNKTHMHDRHSGEPVSIQPVHGDDSSSDAAGSEGWTSEDEGGRTEEELGSTATAAILRVLTWNVGLQHQCRFLIEASANADILCLQEMTPASSAWLETELGQDFDIVTPPKCGGAWDAEGHGVAIAVRRATLEARAPTLHNMTSEQQRSLMAVRVHLRRGHFALIVATAHLESGVEGKALRKKQLAEAAVWMHDDGVDGAVLGLDCNIRQGEDVASLQEQGLGEDAWQLAGAPQNLQWTWTADLQKSCRAPPQRFDRIFLRGRRAASRQGGPDGQSLELCSASFHLHSHPDTDHCGVQCSLRATEARETQRRRRARQLSEPLRAGVRARLGARGVARRPAKKEACAKAEPHTEHNEGGPEYYCGKHFEKPRIRAGDAAILQDERRKGLWRLSLPRNCAHINAHLVAAAIALGANSDAQPVLTAKGVADYVTKYITKYGAGMSVSARIASLLDDIVSRAPEGRTMTVDCLVAKAFIATAVPECLCCLEAWHILWNLPRTISSRYFRGLNMDGLTGVKKPSEVEKFKEAPGGRDGPANANTQEEAPKITRASVSQLYRDRMDLPCKSEAFQRALPRYSLLRFSAEVDFRGGSLYARRGRPRIMNLKPYLQLDLTKPTAVKHAKMSLRMLRPWHGLGQDPMELSDEVALANLEEFAQSLEAPRWFRKRFEHHNREFRQGPSPATRAAAHAAGSDPVAPVSDSTRAVFNIDVASDLKLAAVRSHGLLWDRDANNPAWSVREALRHAKGKQAPLPCLKEILLALGATQRSLPRSRLALTEELVLHILYIDAEEYERSNRGVVKKSLPKHALSNAAQAWKDYHKSTLQEEPRKALATTKPYALLWNAYKKLFCRNAGFMWLPPHQGEFIFQIRTRVLTARMHLRRRAGGAIL